MPESWIVIAVPTDKITDVSLDADDEEPVFEQTLEDPRPLKHFKALSVDNAAPVRSPARFLYSKHGVPAFACSSKADLLPMSDRIDEVL